MWRPTTATRKISKMEGRVKAVFGGASAGKTYSIIPILIDRALCNPNEVITIVSDTARNLRDGAMRDFKDIMISLERWNREQFNKSQSKYEFKNGSIIEFLGADEPDKFRGPRRHRLYVNEANRIQFETFNQMDSRTRKEVFLDWNPTAPFWYDEHIKGTVEDLEELRLTYLDNESLSKMEIKEFERKKMLSNTSDYWHNWWQVYGLGLQGTISGACITDFKICEVDDDGNFWYNGDPLQGYKAKDGGLDFGDNHPNAAVQLYNKENESFIFDEVLFKNKMRLTDIYAAVRNLEGVIYADYSHPQTIRYLQDRGLKVTKCKKGPDSIKHGIDLLNEKDIYITSRSENLLKELQTYRYAEDKNGHKVDGKYEGSDHLIDACRYVLREACKPSFYVV